MTKNSFWHYANIILDKLVTIALIIATIFLIYNIYDGLYVYRHSGKNMGGLLNEKTDDEAFPKDAIGWLKIDDTIISFPIMQGKDNDEYLNKDAYGEYSIVGSVFLDWRNSKDWSDDYNLLYGHHVAANQMFGALDKYKEEQYFKSHRDGFLQTKEADYKLKIFAVLDSVSEDFVIFDVGADAHGGILKHIREKAGIYEEPDGEKILAMSTCQTSSTTKRLVVLATMEKVKTPGTLGQTEKD